MLYSFTTQFFERDSAVMNPILAFLLLTGGAFLLGGAGGWLCRLVGFSGLEGFFSRRGAPALVSGCGLVLFFIFLNLCAMVVSPGLSLWLMTFFCSALTAWGFLLGLDFNAWKLLGMSETPSDELIRGEGTRSPDFPSSGSKPKLNPDEPKKPNIEMKWPDLDDL